MTFLWPRVVPGAVPGFERAEPANFGLSFAVAFSESVASIVAWPELANILVFSKVPVRMAGEKIEENVPVFS